MIRFKNDPLQWIEKAFKTMFPRKKIPTIEWHDNLNRSRPRGRIKAMAAKKDRRGSRAERGRTIKGVTGFDGRGRAVYIWISARIPYRRVPEILAHELTHIGLGAKCKGNASHGLVFHKTLHELFHLAQHLQGKAAKHRKKSDRQKSRG